MSEETVDSRKLEALSETFKKLGWDERIPQVVSKWGEFHCTDEAFGIKIINPDGKVTEVDLLIDRVPYQPEAVRHVVIRWGWGGSNLEIRAFPVTKIICADPKLMSGEKEEAIVIVAPWEKFAYTITESGRVMIQQ